MKWVLDGIISNFMKRITKFCGAENWRSYKPLFCWKALKATLSDGLPDEATPFFNNTSLKTSKPAKTTVRLWPISTVKISPYLCARCSIDSRTSSPRKLNMLPTIGSERGPGGSLSDLWLLNKTQTTSTHNVSVRIGIYQPNCIDTSIVSIYKKLFTSFTYQY